MPQPVPLPPAFLTRPIAHRALHDLAQGRPENSRAAILAAVAAGYPIEMDLQPSADGVAMVFHDDDLDRLTNRTGPIRQRSAADLAAIGLNGAQEAIPTLAEVLDLVAGRVPLLIEVKDQDGAMGPGVGPLEQATAAALAGYGGPVALMSFNPHSVRALARLCPDRPIGLTSCAATARDYPGLSPARRDELARMALAEDGGLAFVSHHHSDLANPRIAALKQRGLAILCWTIRSPAEAAAATRFADNITFEGYVA